MTYHRDCKCSHGFPVCACFESITGNSLDRRSRTLSSLAGWPAPRLDPDTVARVLATYGRPAPAPQPVAARDCGCGQSRPTTPNP